MADDVAPPTAHNPYGDTAGAGISLAPYFRPTPSVKNNNTLFPQTESLGADEMRISFVGSCPFPPTLEQAATCIMVELRRHLGARRRAARIHLYPATVHHR